VARAKLKAKAQLKAKSGRLRLSALALEESAQIKSTVDGKKSNVKYTFPVSIFRRKDLFSKKTGKLKRGVGRDAVDLISVAYQSALTGVGHSQMKKSRNTRPVGESMVWPGPKGRSLVSRRKACLRQ